MFKYADNVMPSFCDEDTLRAQDAVVGCQSQVPGQAVRATFPFAHTLTSANDWFARTFTSGNDWFAHTFIPMNDRFAHTFTCSWAPAHAHARTRTHTHAYAHG